jgi:hypothetical protein
LSISGAEKKGVKDLAAAVVLFLLDRPSGGIVCAVHSVV